jgi:uncharacterized membrane protein (DUF2068 family)
LVSTVPDIPILRAAHFRVEKWWEARRGEKEGYKAMAALEFAVVAHANDMSVQPIEMLNRIINASLF